MLPTNRIKLNRNAFRLESGSVPKRRRAVGDPRDADPLLTACGHRATPTPEPVRQPPGDPGGGIMPPCNTGGVGAGAGAGPSRCAVINDTNETVPGTPAPRRSIRCRLRFALRFSDHDGSGKHVRHAQTEPGTVACYINGNVCVASAVPRSGSAEPAVLSTADGEQSVAPPRRQRGRPPCSSGVKPAQQAPWTRADQAEAPSERDSGATGDQCISDIAVGHDGCPETSSSPVTRLLDHKRLTSDERTSCLPSSCGGVLRCGENDDNGAEDPAVASVDREGTVTTVPPVVLQCASACNGFGSSQFTQCKLSVDHNSPVVGESEAHSGLLEEDSEREESSPHSFSCQRTQAYVTRPRFSCARTCRSWPFPRRGPPSEMKSSARTGPHWIPTSRASDSTEYDVRHKQTTLRMTHNCTTEKKVKDGLFKILGSDNKGPQGQTVSAKLNRMESNSSEVQENAEDPAEHQKETAQAEAAQSEHSIVKRSDHSHSAGTEPVPLSPNKASRFGAVKQNSSEAVENSSPKIPPGLNNQSDLLSTTQHDCPVQLDTIPRCDATSVPEIKSVELRSLDSDVRTQSLPLDKTLEEKSLDHFQDTGLKQKSTQQTSPIMLHPREETLSTSVSSSKRECSKVEPPTDPLCLKSTDPVISQPNSYSESWKGGLTSKDDSLSSSSSSSGEDKYISSHLSGDCSKEVDQECSSLQGELSKSTKTYRISSPLHSPESSVVASDELDVLRAYEEDAIVLDVIQDDPDLFGIMETAESLMLKSGQVASKKGTTQAEKTTAFRNRSRIIWSAESERKRTAAESKMENPNYFRTVDISEPSQGSMSQLSRSSLPMNPMLKPEQAFTDCNNNLRERCVDMNVGNMVNSTGSSRLVIDARNCVRSTAGSGTSAPRSSSAQYCRYYFSEHCVCMYNVCWYLHSPRDEDEKFCMDVVQRFCRAGNPPIVQRAVVVFVEYYRTNSPGVSFSQSIVNSLLSSLLNLALIRDLLTVIRTLLSHKKTPPPDLVVALYEHVSEKGLLTSVPELILLTSKIIEAGCVFTVNQCKMMQSQLQMLQVPRQQMEIFHAVKCRALATNPQTAEVSALAQAVVQVEVCTQQENWPELARVFCSVCVGHYSAGEVSRFCCCVTMALLKESKDKLTLPYEPFAETVCQEVQPDGLVTSFLGRVGVSLMFRYYRIHEWAKGMKVVLVMSRLQLEFSTIKGMGNGMSRCKLITTAAELFLNSGSIEGALNVLRADGWFVSSSTWPCEPGDVENRRRVLTLLAGKTSHRDTLEVLSNLPGLSKPVDGVQVVGEYCSVFNTHLQKCVMNQVLPVAADTLEFMLTQGITPDASQLQNVVHRLGKQNVWNRARALFKRARSAGYYSEVGCAKDSLALPCSLSEIEMTLAFEMFITCVRTSLQNLSDSSQPLLITLKRTSGGATVMESLYLAAGCRMLSAALIPNPKLSIRYMAVNQDQEQIFHLDRGSASKWLSHNHTWAQDMWAS
ncbi:uncharacterized protein topaz1 [Salminus brasiliensis]|uniref:uncharacterized protein topaz1 n=1 Tax=Salminus brasiliensis TaxID=930266 RepID=UPI003B834BA6